MDLSSLTAISPLDGRYASKTAPLRGLVSEYGLIKARTTVEIKWLIFLANTAALPELKAIGPSQVGILESILSDFGPSEAAQIKAIEAQTNHDVKAVEYFIKNCINDSQDSDLISIIEFVHFACTSEDINNLAHALMLKEAMMTIILPSLDRLDQALERLAEQTIDQPMLARTHGQTASPTTVGKEIVNVAARLKRQREQLNRQHYMGKINGAVGNFNAHVAAYPETPWPELSRQFVESLDLTWNAYTTQIEPHDYMAELFQNIGRINTVLIDFNRDIWSYISVGYFKQRAIAGETGSSTMPHKVNPIDFENSEGNLGIANALLHHLAEKLPISRWQRDLSDSTVLRNLGAGLAYSLIAYESTLKGMGKLELNRTALSADLEQAWEVLGEAAQTVMRKHGISNPYELIKEKTRGQALDASGWKHLVDALDLPDSAKEPLLKLRPADYTGLAKALSTGYQTTATDG
ncbi:MAG: adenylosuccinate lyase [Pseudomonadales bacterium]|nr:adenylosuccinate lyase [Pseudomonadales bacterium]